MRICRPIAGIGPSVGETQLVADRRICKPVMNVSPSIGSDGIIVYYGTDGYIDYGGSGEIIY